MTENGPGHRPRTCFYIPVEQFDDTGYIPSLVTEGSPGHSPLRGAGPHARPWYWGRTYEEAKANCARANASMGISPAEALEIVASSVSCPEATREHGVTEPQREAAIAAWAERAGLPYHPVPGDNFLPGDSPGPL